MSSSLPKRYFSLMKNKNIGDMSEDRKTEQHVLRQLDAEVAQRVMGWQRQPDYNYWMSFPAGESFSLHALIATWHPSEDVETAMQVVERVAAPGIHFMSDYLVQRNGEKRWFAQFLRDGLTDGLHNEWIEAPTLPEAICRAALAAVTNESAKRPISDRGTDGQAS